MATLIFSSNTLPAFRGRVLGPKIIAHSIRMTLLLLNVIVPPSTGNFNIPCAVDGMTRIFLIPGIPIILLCWDGDLTTMKFIHAEVECPLSPIFTSRDIWPRGQMVSLLNPVKRVEWGRSDTLGCVIWGGGGSLERGSGWCGSSPLWISCGEYKTGWGDPRLDRVITTGEGMIELAPCQDVKARSDGLVDASTGGCVVDERGRDWGDERQGIREGVEGRRYHRGDTTVNVFSDVLNMASIPCPWNQKMSDPGRERIAFFTRPRSGEIILNIRWFFGTICLHDDAFLPVPQFPLLGNFGGDYQSV
ncbi:hypothetical protein Tco_0580232 [Tanacetum coccineum]